MSDDLTARDVIAAGIASGVPVNDSARRADDPDTGRVAVGRRYVVGPNPTWSQGKLPSTAGLTVTVVFLIDGGGDACVDGVDDGLRFFIDPRHLVEADRG